MGLLALLFLSLFAVAEILYYKFKVRAELTRKLVHIGTGFLTLLFPIMLHDQRTVLILCFTFALIILASLKFNFLRSINGIDRKSYGSISYPVSVYGCYLVYYYLKPGSPDPYIYPNPYVYFYLPILTLAVCDPVAALTGKKFPYGQYKIGKDVKTATGSSSFFVSSVVLTLFVYWFLYPNFFSIENMLPIALLIAVFSTISEALSGKGIDNITIPVVVLLVLILFE
jgi:dolichol kinase